MDVEAPVKGAACEGAGRSAMFVFAHQDDEIAYMGLMRRMPGIRLSDFRDAAVTLR